MIGRIVILIDWRPASRSRRPSHAVIYQMHTIPVTLAERPHPFPSRTRKLSSPAPKILRGQPFGKIGRRRDCCVNGASRPVDARRAPAVRRPLDGSDGILVAMTVTGEPARPLPARGGSRRATESPRATGRPCARSVRTCVADDGSWRSAYADPRAPLRRGAAAGAPRRRQAAPAVPPRRRTRRAPRTWRPGRSRPTVPRPRRRAMTARPCGRVTAAPPLVLEPARRMGALADRRPARSGQVAASIGAHGRRVPRARPRPDPRRPARSGATPGPSLGRRRRGVAPSPVATPDAEPERATASPTPVGPRHRRPRRTARADATRRADRATRSSRATR